MDVHLLKTFVAAYEEANFTKAAKRLNATQPGVSAQIAVLEAGVGTSLFDRNARRVTPTAAGRHLYPRALQLIHDLNSAKLAVLSLSGAATRRVAVGVPPTLGEGVIAKVLPKFLEAYSRAEVQIVQECSSTLTSMIDNGELDIAFVTHPDERSSVTCRKVFTDNFLVASGSALGLSAVEPVRLDAEPLHKIVFPSRLRRDLQYALEKHLMSGRIVAARSIEMDCFAATLELVAKSDWIAVIPAAAGYDSESAPGVRFSPIAGEEISLDYYALQARTEPMSIATKAFSDMFTLEINRARQHWLSLDCPPVLERRVSLRA
ncbi:MAG TPA: LysR family transcriptional regulator [Steroidobacteraceae bacterium]|jgi:DNA-binding transcriptional LysR family regulator|nr:LysR family transcriptional regulator [Steroidobacteraceae bacterium]